MTPMEFRSALPAGSRGYLEICAAALGEVDAVARTIAGLGSAEFAKGALGKAISPNIIALRIEALAAYDPRLLEGLSRAWLPIEHLGNDVHDVATEFQATAWKYALRHMDWPVVGGATRNELVSRELSILEHAGDGIATSWTDLVEGFSRSEIGYDDLRGRIAVAKSELSSSDIDFLLTAVDRQQGPFQVLRVFRAANVQVEDAAITTCRDWADRWPDMRPGEAVCLFEFLVRQGIVDMATIRKWVASFQASGQSDAIVWPTLFCLGWLLP